MPSKKASVLVVDGDIRIVRIMQRTLEQEDYHVFVALDGEVALDMFAKENPDLVLLTTRMSGMDGYAVCQRIREFSQMPIIMVTAGSDEEYAAGLNADVDGYVTKPFSSRELVARVKAVLRRTNLQDEHPEPTFCSGDLVVDSARQRVTLANNEINLTATEYRILCYLARNAGRVVTPDLILERVWGERYVGDTHLLQVNITRLRQKLGDSSRNPRYILTRPGIGYMMMERA